MEICWDLYHAAVSKKTKKNNVTEFAESRNKCIGADGSRHFNRALSQKLQIETSIIHNLRRGCKDDQGPDWGTLVGMKEIDKSPNHPNNSLEGKQPQKKANHMFLFFSLIVPNGNNCYNICWAFQHLSRKFWFIVLLKEPKTKDSL